jgi:acyl dehydratase
LDYTVGQSFETPSRTITEADVVLFAGLSGDYNRIHVDDEYSKKTYFGGRVAHGALTFAVTTGLWYSAALFRDRVKAFYGVDSLRFTAPVHIGDTVHCVVNIKGVIAREHDVLVEFESKTLNQKGETVLWLVAKMLLYQ